jgi:hypothetical protein
LADDGRNKEAEMRTCEVEMWDGKVACPYSPAEGVDVETCYRCSRLRAFHDEESGTKVVCAGPMHLFGEHRGLLSRRHSHPQA